MIKPSTISTFAAAFFKEVVDPATILFKTCGNFTCHKVQGSMLSPLSGKLKTGWPVFDLLLHSKWFQVQIACYEQ
jgi:hypothetical protein